jgi:hypothetical protein
VARCLILQNVTEYADLNEMSVREAYNHPTAQRARQLFSRNADVGVGEFPSPCGNCSYFKRHHGGPNMDKFGALGIAKPAEFVSLALPGEKSAVAVKI